MTPVGRTSGGFCLPLAMLLGLVSPIHAQIIDARLIPRGSLRVAFTPQYQSWDHWFGSDGALVPIGRYLSADTAGVSFFPTLAGPEAAIRAITGNQSFRLSLGSITHRVDADVRRFPFEFSLGLARWLTISATLPIVVTRVNAALAADTSSGNAGWNQAAFESGNAAGRPSIDLLLAQLDNGATALESMIGSGSYGCPGSAMCAQAQGFLARTRDLRSNLAILSGRSVSSTGLPPLAPLAGSVAGAAIDNAIRQVSDSLQVFGVSSLGTLTMPLPSRRLTAAEVQSIFSSASFGFNATLPAYSKRPHLGDLEVGARLGVLQAARARLVIFGGARLPTGSLDSPDNLVDIGTGDHQTDLVGGFEAAAEAGSVSLTAAGSYTLQLPGPIVARITPPTQPIALANTAATLTRDLGDVLWVGAYPALHLSQAFRAYGSVSYYRKAVDRYQSLTATESPAVLELQTAMRSVVLGGGVAYRVVSRGNALPIDAGVSFQRAVSGSGGFTPKATVVTMYLRAYYRIWGQKQS